MHHGKPITTRDLALTAAEKAKDVAAGAVLTSAIGAVLIGVLVFWPKMAGLP